MSELTIDGKPLNSLRVVDLKEELEKKGLSKSGSKKELYDRLKAHLVAERQRQAVPTDDEQLPNISIQNKLAEQNPFLRDYFASQAELFHSQKLAKKLYHEEKKRESEASADETGSDSPTKSRGGSPMKSPTPLPLNNSTKEDNSPQKVETGADSLAKSNISSPVENPSPTCPLPVNNVVEEDKSPKKVDPEVKETSSAPVTVGISQIDTAGISKDKVTEISGDNATGIGKDRPRRRFIREADLPKEVTQDDKESSSAPVTVEISQIDTAGVPKDKVGEISGDNAPGIEKVRPRRRFEREADLPKEVTQADKEVLDDKLDKLKPDNSIRRGGREIIFGVKDNKPEAAKSASALRSTERICKEVLDFGEDDKDKREPKVDLPQKLAKKKSHEEAKIDSQASVEEASSDNNTKSSEGSPIQDPPPLPLNKVVKEDKVAKQVVQKVEESSSGRITTDGVSQENKPRRRLVRGVDLSRETSKEEKPPAEDKLNKATSDTPKRRGGKEIVFDFKDKKPEPAKRTISVRSTEGLGDEVLDFGEDEKDKKEPDRERPTYTRRILRIKNKPPQESSVKVGWTYEGHDKKPFNPSWLYFKEMYPDLEFIPDEDLKLDTDETVEEDHHDTRRPSRHRFHDIQITRTISNELVDNGVEADQNDDERPKIEISLKRTISTIPMEEEDRELSPSRNPPSHVLKVTNLVRPFTLTQLKELLQRTGNVVDLWVDKIKSKCVAKFEKEDEGIETRAALHGVKWPASNTKALRVDFSTEEELHELQAKERIEEKPKIDDKPSGRSGSAVREWDMGKRGRSRERRRSGSPNRDADRKRPRRSSRSPNGIEQRSAQRDHRERGRKESVTTPKALDELFRKTVATPCIYWLPLTPQQIAEKEEVRRKRMLERDRKISEMTQHRVR